MLDGPQHVPCASISQLSLQVIKGGGICVGKWLPLSQLLRELCERFMCFFDDLEFILLAVDLQFKHFCDAVYLAKSQCDGILNGRLGQTKAAFECIVHVGQVGFRLAYERG